MVARKERLRKLVEVQEQLKAFHEMRRAGFLSAAASAAEEAAALAARFGQPGSLADLFPDLYVRRIDAALARERRNLDGARIEAASVAAATARTNMVERSWKEAVRADERLAQDRETLEAVMNAIRSRRGGDAGK